VKIKTQHLTLILIVCLITFCIQTADIKFGFIKVSELILLLLTPFLLKKSINKFIFYFLIFFTLEAILGLIITSTQEFDILGASRFKAPYVITIGRYFELVSCLILCIITFRLFQKQQTNSRIIIHYLVNWNIIITIVFAVIYVLVFSGILPLQSSIVVYENNRLRGFYNEGGPYGLMLSFIFMLTSFQPKSNIRILKQIFLFVIIAFCARSKAGVLLIVVWIAMLNFEYLKQKFKILVLPIIVVFLIGFYYLFINISSMYITELNRVKQSVVERPTDINLILGRVSGTYIVPNMVKENPFFGIGLGNYPLLRNNTEYRAFFPKPPKDVLNIDAHGFGGLVDIIVEMGIIGFILFVSIIYQLYKELKSLNKGHILLTGFLLLFCFGVQIYFLYPWAFLGIILAYRNNYIDEISN
jgi:hypothetical protein